MKIVARFFYNILAAASLFQRSIYGRYYSVGAVYKTLNLVLSFIALAIFTLVLILTDNPVLAIVGLLIPIVFLFIFIARDKSRILEEKIEEFKVSSKVNRFFYLGLIIVLCGAMPIAMLMLLLYHWIFK